MKYLAIINTPGYLSNQDELPEFDNMSDAWSYLLDERIRDMNDPMNDEADDAPDSCMEELAGMILTPELGTVYGFTPGYEGDHDLGLAYTVMAQDGSEVTLASDTKRDWSTEVNTFPMGV